METIGYPNHKKYRVNYRKLRITQVMDLQESQKLRVEGFIRCDNGKRIILNGYIPYTAISKNSDHARELLDSLILKLPVGVKSKDLSIFERNLLNSLCRTLVMANPDLSIRRVTEETVTVTYLIGSMIAHQYKPFSISKSDIMNDVKCSEAELDETLHIINGCYSDDGNGILTIYPEITSLFYDVSSPVAISETQSTIEDSSVDMAPSEDNGLEIDVPEPPENYPDVSEYEPL